MASPVAAAPRDRAWTLTNMRLQNAPPSGYVTHIAFDTSALVDIRVNGSVARLPRPGFPLFAGALRLNAFAAERRVMENGSGEPVIPKYAEKQAFVRLNVLSLRGPSMLDHVNGAIVETFRDKYRVQSPAGFASFGVGYEAEALAFLRQLKPDLFLTGDPLMLAGAVIAKIPSVFVPPFPNDMEFNDLQLHSGLRLIFDGDRCIIGPENDERTNALGIIAAAGAEVTHQDTPHKPGPLHDFFLHAHQLRTIFPAGKNDGFDFGLATARGTALYARLRTTLGAWGVEPDFENYTSGMPKREFLAALRPTFFFDDAPFNVNAALDAGIPAGQVVAHDETLRRFIEQHALQMSQLSDLGIQLAV